MNPKPRNLILAKLVMATVPEAKQQPSLGPKKGPQEQLHTCTCTDTHSYNRMSAICYFDLSENLFSVFNRILQNLGSATKSMPTIRVVIIQPDWLETM